MTQPAFLQAQWPAPANVRAVTTLRTGGVSCGPYTSLNLALHVGDAPEAVEQNRSRIKQALQLPSEPSWLHQVHGTQVHIAGTERGAQPPEADACVSREAGRVCVVMTADCLPVVFCSHDGRRIGVAHAGWKGLVAGVLERTIDALGGDARHLMAWLGPAIEPDAFEVGDEVRERFIQRDARHAPAFERNGHGRWQADLYTLARGELQRSGVRSIYGGGFRCFADADRFFSYRREGTTGRMATLVWRTD